MTKHAANFDAQPLGVTRAEFRRLQTLLDSPGRAFTRNRAHDDERDVMYRAVDSQIRNLRQRFRTAREGGELIRSVYRVGCKLEP